LPEFETAIPPEDYQPHGMLARQIRLVDGQPSDLKIAIRQEWKAREQRSRWLNSSPAMASKINDYDLILQDEWSSLHMRLKENCAELEEKDKRAKGLQLLRWTQDEAHKVVRPISVGWESPYYVRGSYQVLAINLAVGWHPLFDVLLKDAE